MTAIGRGVTTKEYRDSVQIYNSKYMPEWSANQLQTVAFQPTPSKSQEYVQPFPFISMVHLDKKVVHHHSFTQHPEEGSQEEVVEQESYYLAGNL